MSLNMKNNICFLIRDIVSTQTIFYLNLISKNYLLILKNKEKPHVTVKPKKVPGS